MEATASEPVLSGLAALAVESGERLCAIRKLLPEGLRQAVQPGPIQGDTWCLLVTNPSALTKLRNHAPALVRELQSKGYEVSAIRVKIQASV